MQICIFEIFTNCINQSIGTSNFLNCLKMANITPVFKKDDPFVDGSSHVEGFCKISALETLNFTKIIQCFVLRSLEFVCGRFFLGEDRTLVWVVDLHGFYMFSLDVWNISFFGRAAMSILPLCVFFCDTLLVGYWPALIPKVSFSLSGNPRNLLFSINLEKHFCWSVNYNLVFISRRSLESSPYIIVKFIAIIFSYQF